jgi:hypothetical protein
MVSPSSRLSSTSIMWGQLVDRVIGRAGQRVVKSLSLPEDDLVCIEHVLRGRFAEVSRGQLATLVVFKAVRSR